MTTQHATLEFYREAYEKTLARAEALDTSITRLYELSAQHTEAYGIACAERDAALHRLSDETRKREAAEAIADPYVCDFIRNEGGEGGWREIETEPESMEDVLAYAASRGLLERDPKVPARFRFTKAGEEHL